MTSPAGDIGPEPTPAAGPALPPEPHAPAPSPALVAACRRWSERDRRRPDDGVLAPQHRYPGRIATP